MTVMTGKHKDVYGNGKYGHNNMNWSCNGGMAWRKLVKARYLYSVIASNIFNVLFRILKALYLLTELLIVNYQFCS